MRSLSLNISYLLYISANFKADLHEIPRPWGTKHEQTPSSFFETGGVFIFFLHVSINFLTSLKYSVISSHSCSFLSSHSQSHDSFNCYFNLLSDNPIRTETISFKLSPNSAEMSSYLKSAV